MLVGSPGLLNTPCKIDQAEREQRPTGEVSAQTFDFDERCELRTHQDANGTNDHGTHDVPDAAGQCDLKRFRKPPRTRLTHGHEDQVVIGADYGMNKSN